MKEAPPSSSPSLRFSLVTVWFALFCDYFLLTVAVPIFPQLGKSDFQTGILFATKAILQVLSAPVVARYIDSYNLEPMILGLAIEALSTLVFAFTSNYWWWCVARAISGISSSMIISSGFLHIQRRHSGDNEGMGIAMSLVVTGIISGVTFGPPIGGLLYGFSHGLPFFFTFLLAALAMLQTVVLSRRLAAAGELSIAASAEAESAEVFRQKVRNLLSDKHVVVTLLALFCANGAISCLEATFGNFMQGQFGFSVFQVGMLYVIAAVPSVIGSKIAGGLGNK